MWFPGRNPSRLLYGVGALDPVEYEMTEMTNIWRSDCTVDGAEFESAFGVWGRCAHLALVGGRRVGSATARKQLGDDGVVCWLAMHVGSLKMIECDAIRFCTIGTLCSVLSGSLSCPYPYLSSANSTIWTGSVHVLCWKGHRLPPSKPPRINRARYC